MTVRLLLALLCISLAAACGGGGGGGAAANGAPNFTSATTASVVENAAGVIYTAAATDPDGDALTYSIAGGADAALFSINAQSGALSFLAAPDFELAADADSDSIYSVQIAARDAASAATLTLAVTVTDRPGALGFRRLATGLAGPMFLAPIGRSPLLYLAERAGVVRIFNPRTGQVSPFLDISSEVSTAGERGLLGLAVAPDFATSGALYLHINNLNGDTEIRRYRTAPGNPLVADPTSGDVILRVTQPAQTNHKGGWIGFGPDSLLYIALGDGGGSGDPFGNGQNPNTLLGAVLRVDPRGDGFPADTSRDYLIPPNNPFAVSGGAPEIWLTGFRNPFRASFDRDTGNLFIGDVGEGAIEEVDLARPSDGGANYGWNLYEGTQPFPVGSAPAPTTGLTFPIAQYPHGTGAFEGRTVVGGYVYRGPIAALRGHYFFGDFINRRIWSISVGMVTPGVTIVNTQFTDRTMAPDAGAIGSFVSFSEDARGNLYMLDIDGEIFVLTESD